MESREDIEAEILILLGGQIRSNTLRELYEYFESELKPNMSPNNYEIYENHMNNTITLYIDSEELSNDQLIMLLGILKY
jgi:hypothetical protein